MTSVTQLGYLGLSVSNVDEWERFAGQVLGLQGNGRDADGSLFLRMDEYHHRFIVHPTGKDDIAYFGWEVPTEEALQAMAAQAHRRWCNSPARNGSRGRGTTGCGTDQMH